MHVPQGGSTPGNVASVAAASAPSYVSVTVGSVLVNCLVDSGAEQTLVCRALVPSNVPITPTSTTLRGVTGSALKVLGAAQIPLQFGNITLTANCVVVNHMNNHQFILGSDFMVPNQCVINYRKLSFSIKESDFPLIRACNRTAKYTLMTDSTTVIQPNTVALVKCSITSTSGRGKSSKSYISATGIVDQRLFRDHRHALTANSGFYNSNKGSVDILVCNGSSNSIEISRRCKLGHFTTMTSKLVRSLNNCHMIHSKTVAEKEQACNEQPHASRTETTSSMSTPATQRWAGSKLSDLFRLLKLDELTHLTAEQHEEVKRLVEEFRDIFSEGESDIGCTDIMTQTIVLDTHIPISLSELSIATFH